MSTRVGAVIADLLDSLLFASACNRLQEEKRYAQPAARASPLSAPAILSFP